jgi:antitoxin (DNA-binding transcriptional repressor) of toxin-antitoxin stability system
MASSPAPSTPGPGGARQVSKSRFKAHALELFRQVEASGEPLVITDHGRPCLEVRPYRPQTDDPLERLRGSVLHFEDPFEPVATGEWEALG